MKFTFVNQTIFSSSTNLRDLGGQFDGIGKIQFVNKGIADAKASVLAVEEKFKSAFYRQDEEEKFLTSEASKAYFEDRIKDFPFSSQGKLDTVLIYSRKPGYLEKWNSIDVYGLNDSYSIIEKKKDFMNSNGRVVVQYDNDKTPYTLIHYKFTNNIILRNIYVYKSLDQIVEVQLKDNKGDWTVATNLFANFGLFNPEFSTFLVDNFVEAKIIYKNVKITNRYSLEAKVKVSKYSVSSSSSFSWYGYSINSLTLNSTYYSFLENNEHTGMYADLFISINNQIYQVQIPSAENPMLRLLPDKRYSSSSEFYSIFKCPYPLVSTPSIDLFTNLHELNSSVQWKASLDKINWYTKDELLSLDYGTQYGNTPKYVYFRVLGYVEECFLIGTINKSPNSIWPLSEDGVLYFNGSGIGIKNPEGSPVTITGTLYTNGIVHSVENTPIAILGVD